MSNHLIIAAVTSTLQQTLTNRILFNGVQITTKPLDKARTNNNGNQINLFLYHTKENAALRNMEMSAAIKPGESSYPPLALNLYYLLTTYGQNDDEPNSHRLLGEAMNVFNDNSTLAVEDIKNALPEVVYNQIDRVRITHQGLSLDEIFKLWATFQTQYRITVAYEVSVVLIESTRPTTAPSPVLTRGESDAGATAQASLIPPYPTLIAINFPALETAKQGLAPSQAALIKQPAANLGENITLTGYNLDQGNLRVLFQHPSLPTPLPITTGITRTATEINLTIPTPANQWLAGFYTVSAEITVNPGTVNEKISVTNGLPLPIAPNLQGTITASKNPLGTILLQVQCRPQVAPEQRVALILTVLSETLPPSFNPAQDLSLKVVSDRELIAKPHTTTTDQLEFEISRETLERIGIRLDPGVDKKISAGSYEVRPRLRVDGVDSLIVNYAIRPPVFIGTQTLVIAP
jgi:Pvc16 N-terminal domain